jgi:hypothetical protein
VKLYEVFLSGSTPQVDDEGLLWKEILPEGESAYTPTPSGPLKRPFKVVANGPGDLSKGVASLEEIKQSFEDGAFENVQVILASKKKDPETGEGGDHDEITANNTGFVRKLRIEDKPNAEGKKRLMAGIEFTEPDVKDKCERGTFANCSAGLVGDVINMHTGKRYPQAIRHLSITNRNWVGGMDKFGSQIMASDDDIDSVAEVNLDASDVLSALDEPEAGSGGDIVWKDNKSAEWIRDRVNGSLQKLVEKAAPDANIHFWVKDVAPTDGTALIVQDGEAGNGNTFVAPYEINDDDLNIASPDKWTQTRQVHIAASSELSDDQLKQRVQNALRYNLSLGSDYVVEEVGKDTAIVKNELADASWEVGWDLSADRIWLDPPEEWRKSTGNVVPREEEQKPVDKSGDRTSDTNLSDEVEDSSPRGVLIAARKERGLQNNDSKTGGNKVSKKKLDLESLNLSDDQRTALEAQLAAEDEDAKELERLRKEARVREVDDKIAELSEAGLKDNPGVLKFVKSVFLSDDQKPSILLSDDGSAQGEPQSVTKIFDEFFGLLKNQQGKIALSTQSADLSDDDDHNRPPDDTSDELTHEQRMEKAASELGLPQRTPVNR